MKPSLESVITAHYRSLYSAAYSICGNHPDTEDAVQDAFTRYFTSKKHFESQEHIRAWLLRVVMNRAIDICRARKRHPLPLDENLTPCELQDPQEQELLNAVLELPEHYRMPLHLHYYEDYSIKEIAAILRLRESTVKMRLLRGKEQLRKRLLKEESFYGN